MIRTLHLLTILIFTWVPVPSDIYLIFLWVALANVTLFACLLHINAAEKIASLHLMRQLWLLPGRLTLSAFLLCEAHPTTHVCLGWFSLWRGCILGPYLCVRGDIPPRTSFKIDWAQQDWARSLLVSLFPLGHGWAPCGAQGPLLALGILPLQVYLDRTYFTETENWKLKTL